VTTTTDSAPDLLALESQVCFALAVASRRVIGLYRPVLEPLGLTHPQYLVMLALWQHEPLSVRRLGELVSLEPATLSPLLKRLEAVGYVRRERDRHDERQLSVTLTEPGKALRADAERIPPAVVQRLDMDLSDLQQLHGMLTEVIKAARLAAAAPEAASG
jgi:MarR family transcriptional regulator, organic hydroperoxide resistance regulator